jgi:uncharacterized membrane protein
MRRIWQFVKTTVLGGAIFLLPIAATLVIIVKAGKMAVDTATPLSQRAGGPSCLRHRSYGARACIFRGRGLRTLPVNQS